MSTKPTHDMVKDAVRRSGDKELQALVGGPDSYVIRAEDMADVEHHHIYRVLFTHTDHPMSFWLATHHDGRGAWVLSGHADNINAFLKAEPKVRGADDLVARFHELFRPQHVHTRIAEDPAPKLSRDGGLTTIRYEVVVDGERERWTASLPETGKATVHMELLD